MPGAESVLILLYYELVFGFRVFGSGFASSFPHVLLSSIYFCLPFVLLLASLKGKAGITARILLRLLGALPFLVESFIYMQFKTLYDIRTVFFGGKGAITGFGSTIRSLVLSRGGLLIIFLYSLPTIICIVRVLIKRFEFKSIPKWQKGVITMLIPLAFFINASLTACSPTDKAIHGKEYSFNPAAERFGLLEALALDIRNCGTAQDVIEFEEVIIPVVTVAPQTFTPTATPAPFVTGPAEDAVTPTPSPTPYLHVMDIDFDAIADSETGTISSLAAYCASQVPSTSNEYTGLFEGKNLIMITAEAFTAEAIDPVLTPYLYRLATRGINFTDSYIPATAGTIGGEFSHVFGLLPSDGGVSFYHLAAGGDTYLTMGQRLNASGYYGAAFHNNDYQFYTRNVTHNLLGYSEGYRGWGNGLESYIDPVWPESDLQLMEATIPDLIPHQPFNAYYMSVSGHSNYSRGANAMSRKHWDETSSLEDVYSSPVRAYIACQMELDRAVGYILGELEAAGIADDTVIAICADHYPYGLDRDSTAGYMHYLSELYGFEVHNTMDRDHNRLIIWCGCLEHEDPIVIDTPTSSLDMLPTLLNLFGVEYDSRLLPGRDVFSEQMPLVFNLGYDWRTDLGTYISSRGEFIPDDPDDPIPDGYVETVRAIVSNKINYCRGVLSSHFFRFLFGDPNEELTREVLSREPVRNYNEERDTDETAAETSTPAT